MTSSPVAVREDRRWYALALRHLRMASRLLRSGFADGATFHIYHAYECILSAFIASKGFPVPPDGSTTITLPNGKKAQVYPLPNGPHRERSAHKVRIIFFDQLADTSKAYYPTHQRLRRMISVRDRMDSLYYESATDRSPHQRYQERFAQGCLAMVHVFALEVRVEIAR